MKSLADVHFRDAEVIRVILGNLSTHTPAALYEAFEPAEARRIVRKLEFRFTPKLGSWLNMPEIELAVLSKQCLDRRIPSIAAMRCETAAWEAERNAQLAKVNWQFTTPVARIRLGQLYPP